MRALQASWRASDPDAFANLFTPHGVFEDVTYGFRAQGYDALRAHAGRMRKHNADLRIDILRCDATDGAGVCEWRLAHTYHGQFDGIDCTGAAIDIRGLSIYEFSDGKISRASDYWNYMELVRAVGVVPREVRRYRAP